MFLFNFMENNATKRLKGKNINKELMKEFYLRAIFTYHTFHSDCFPLIVSVIVFRIVQ